MNEVKNLPYYIPDQEGIRLYYEEYVDVDAPEYKELRKFLEKRKHNPLSFAELMTALEDNLLLGGGVSQMFLLMKDAGIFLNETHEKRGIPGLLRTLAETNPAVEIPGLYAGRDHGRIRSTEPYMASAA